MEKMPLHDTQKLGKIAKRDVDDDETVEVRWERQLQGLLDIEAKVERVRGRLPWTHVVEFENEGATERWLLRGHRTTGLSPRIEGSKKIHERISMRRTFLRTSVS